MTIQEGNTRLKIIQCLIILRIKYLKISSNNGDLNGK